MLCEWGVFSSPLERRQSAVAVSHHLLQSFHVGDDDYSEACKLKREEARPTCSEPAPRR